MRYTVKPHDVCPTSLSFDLEGDVVRNVEFTRGRNGNLKAISKLSRRHDRRPDLQYPARQYLRLQRYILRRPAGPGSAPVLRGEPEIISSFPCETQEFLHFFCDPFIFVIEDLPPGLHLKSADPKRGQPFLALFPAGWYRQKRDSRIF